MSERLFSDFYDENNSGDNNQGLGKGNEGEREEEEDSIEFSTDHGMSCHLTPTPICMHTQYIVFI